MSDDRTVHAETLALQLVRYDKAGKWYLESSVPALVTTKRKLLSLRTAVDWVMERQEDVIIHWGRPGGTQFDARVRHRLAC